MTTVEPRTMLGKIDASNRGGLILRRLAAYHPAPVSVRDLMEGAGIRPNIEGPVCAAAAFAWWLCRINDDIDQLGWVVARTGDGHRDLCQLLPIVHVPVGAFRERRQ